MNLKRHIRTRRPLEAQSVAVKRLPEHRHDEIAEYFSRALRDPRNMLPAPAKQLLKDGVWNVPENERPRGWEKMNIAERQSA